jgi:hypothetical protein
VKVISYLKPVATSAGAAPTPQLLALLISSRLSRAT